MSVAGFPVAERRLDGTEKSKVRRSYTRRYKTIEMDDALRAAVEWSARYLPDFRLPDKTLDSVDQACAAVRSRTLTPRVMEAMSAESGAPSATWLAC